MKKLRLIVNVDIEVDVNIGVKTDAELRGAVIENLGSYNAANVIILKKKVIDEDDLDADDDDTEFSLGN